MSITPTNHPSKNGLQNPKRTRLKVCLFSRLLCDRLQYTSCWISYETALRVALKKGSSLPNPLIPKVKVELCGTHTHFVVTKPLCSSLRFVCVMSNTVHCWGSASTFKQHSEIAAILKTKMKTFSKNCLQIYLSFTFHVSPLRHMKLNQVLSFYK